MRVLQATNAGVRRPGYEARFRLQLCYSAVIHTKLCSLATYNACCM